MCWLNFTANEVATKLRSIWTSSFVGDITGFKSLIYVYIFRVYAWFFTQRELAFHVGGLRRSSAHTHICMSVCVQCRTAAFRVSAHHSVPLHVFSERCESHGRPPPHSPAALDRRSNALISATYSFGDQTGSGFIQRFPLCVPSRWFRPSDCCFRHSCAAPVHSPRIRPLRADKLVVFFIIFSLPPILASLSHSAHLSSGSRLPRYQCVASPARSDALPTAFLGQFPSPDDRCWL